MTTIVRETLRALKAFGEHHRKRGVATILLQPFFDRLDLATQLHLAHASMIAMCVATIEAQKRWGESGGVVIRDDILHVGVHKSDGFKTLGSGRTPQEAFAQVDKGEV